MNRGCARGVSRLRCSELFRETFPRPLRAGLTYAAPPALGMVRGDGTEIYVELEIPRRLEADPSLRAGASRMRATSLETVNP